MVTVVGRCTPEPNPFMGTAHQSIWLVNKTHVERPPLNPRVRLLEPRMLFKIVGGATGVRAILLVIQGVGALAPTPDEPNDR
jgi:hypothetical protein